LPYDTLIGYKLIGLSSYFLTIGGSNNPCLNDVSNAIEAFNVMRGKDKCGNNIINPLNGLPTSFRYDGDACNRIGWLDSFTHDYRDMVTSGPYTMNILDTQIVVISYNITKEGANNFQNVCYMKSYSDSALKYYYNDFRTCIPIGIQPISNEVPLRFALYQNYPNPFNPVTQIKFDIAKSCNAKITIYDAIGRQITELVNQQLQAGGYEVDWDASSYPSGVYFYVLSSGNYTETKKLILLK
jgi:hypothetical protein